MFAYQIPRRFFIIIGLLIIAVLALSGCAAVGPDYIPVKPETPEKWSTELKGGLNAGLPEPGTMACWWKVLDDPELSSLTERAVSGNLDLQTARARIREARARRGISRSYFFPTLDGGAAADKHRDRKGREDELYTVGFDSSWELDVFGGIRRAVEADTAEVEAAQEDLHDVLVSLLAEVALNYVDVRTYQNGLTVIEANLKAQQETYDLNDSRFQAGIIDELAVQQSLYNLERTRSQIPVIQTKLEAAKNRLAVLLGQAPGAVHAELAARKPIPAPPLQLAIGVPAEVLRQRPDIRRAERRLAAQTARVGVATADLFPKFRLNGSIGLESLSTGNFFTAANRIWDFGPSVSWNIFHGNAIRQNIEIHSALQEQALTEYELTVLQAQEEIENVLVAYANQQRRYQSLLAATKAALKADQLAQDQYQVGLVDFNNVLDAQRSLLLLQDQLTLSEGAVTTNLVRLYKALGGGWQTLPKSR
ncbi:MAG: efflux transporter outer membrane subunit [Deltaproteobacteria bacterium]|nr:efflux transporter outer membrane subunit [Candidatus Tharpella aukensis]